MEWKQEEPNWYIAKCADLMLDVELMETGGDPEPWLWTANLNRAESEGAIEFQSGWAASGDAAKLAAETFARTWIAAQASALGDGWISVSEALPVHGVVVLIGFADTGARRLAYFAGDVWMSDELYPQPLMDNPTHWRPLPPLPVAEVEE